MGWLPDLPAPDSSKLDNSSAMNSESNRTTTSDLITNFFDNFSAEKLHLQGWTYHMLATVIVSYGIYFGIGGLVHVSPLERNKILKYLN